MVGGALAGTVLIDENHTALLGHAQTTNHLLVAEAACREQLFEASALHVQLILFLIS